MGPALGSQAGFAVPFALKDPLTTPSGLKDPEKCAGQLEEAARETLKNFGTLDVPLGEVMRFQLAGVDIPANGGFGNLGIFRVITFGPLHENKRSQIHGETYVAAVEFSKPIKASVLMSYVNSSVEANLERKTQFYK